jgi:hypothetical protein
MRCHTGSAGECCRGIRQTLWCARRTVGRGGKGTSSLQYRTQWTSQRRRRASTEMMWGERPQTPAPCPTPPSPLRSKARGTSKNRRKLHYPWTRDGGQVMDNILCPPPDRHADMPEPEFQRKFDQLARRMRSTRINRELLEVKSGSCRFAVWRARASHPAKRNPYELFRLPRHQKLPCSLVREEKFIDSPRIVGPCPMVVLHQSCFVVGKHQQCVSGVDRF